MKRFDVSRTFNLALSHIYIHILEWFMRKKNAQVEYDIMISRGPSVIVIFCMWLICNFSG